MRPKASTRIRLLLAAIFIIGVVFIFIAHWSQVQWDFGLIHEIGNAFIVAAVLGFAIDVTLHTAIARDVFEATLGHILRPEFRNEVARITGYKFLFEQHVLLIEVQELANDVVEVVTSVERSARNITAYAEKQNAYLHIDDWGFAQGRSEILECRLRMNGKEYIGEKVETKPFRIKHASKEVSVPANGTFTTFVKHKEYRRNNDVVSFYFGMPTLNPEIEVRLPPTLDCTISFGTADSDSATEFQYAKRSRLNGVYFPHQAMSVRWWPIIWTSVIYDFFVWA